MDNRDALVSQYLLSLRADGRSPQTLDWRRDALWAISAWLAEPAHPRDPDRWTSSLRRDWVVHTRPRPNKRSGAPFSPAFVDNQLRRLKAVCRWPHAEEFVGRDLLADVRAPTTS